MSIRKQKKSYVFRKNVLLSIAVATLSLILVGSVAVAGGGGYFTTNVAYAIKQFKVNVSIDKDPIQRGDTQKIKVTVRDADSNDRVSNAFVKLKVESPSGDSDTASGHTNNNGEITFKLKISSHGDTGTYDATIKVSKDGYKTKTINDSFKVRSGHNGGNSNDNGGNNGGGGSNTNNKNSKQTQSIAQANVCGNGNLPLNVKCQNLANQIQGSGNSVNIIGVQ